MSSSDRDASTGPVQLGSRTLGSGQRCFLIAEVAQAHDGSLGTAHAYIDAVARTGADAIKFQTHIAAAESTPLEPWRVHFSRQDETRYAYWQRMEFGPAEWRGLAEHAAQAGLLFLSSPFSDEAVDLLQDLGVPGWKLGAGEMLNLPLVDKVARTGKPVILSTGLADWAEIDAAVETVRAAGAPVILLQCTTAYPCPPERLGLNVIAELRQRYRCPVGLSDHSATIFAGLASAALGADLIEAHVVFSRECFGPDTAASLTTAEFGELRRGLEFIHSARCNPVDKQQAARDLVNLRQTFGKSVVARRDLSAGTVLTPADVTTKKPGTGIAAARLADVVGRTVSRDIKPDVPLTEDDLV